MMTRREALAAAGALMSRRSGFAEASQPATAVDFAVPAHACDCHTHIFGDPRKFPFSPGRSYTPEPALPEEMAALHRSLHIERVVIVTPSVYGTDNSATLYGIRARGPSARGVAVIDGKTTDRDLDALAKTGFRGIHLNLATAGETSPAEARRRYQAVSIRIAARGWHVQIYATLAVISAIKDLILDSPAPVAFNHFGGAKAARGLGQPGFADLVALVRSGKAYVKLSAAYRVSTRADYADAAPLAQALIAANADRILWGTDWPHPNTRPDRRPADVTPLLAIDDGRLLNELPRWAPDPAVRRKILVDNPARLYAFA